MEDEEVELETIYDSKSMTVNYYVAGKLISSVRLPFWPFAYMGSVKTVSWLKAMEE